MSPYATTNRDEHPPFVGRAAFVGRDAELDLLRDRLRRAAGGDAQLVLVRGVAGVGKTTLVRRALSLAGFGAPGRQGTEGAERPGRGLLVWTSGDETERTVPWGVIDQIARAVAPALDPSGSDPAALDLTGLGADTSAGPADIGTALLGLVGSLDEDATVAVVVDDAPWSDPLSLHAITFVLRRLRSDRVVVILTSRTEHLGDLPPGLEQLLRGPNATTILLEPMTSAEIAELASTMGRTLPDDAVRRIHEHSSGSPLHARALLEEMPDRTLTAGDEPLRAPASFGSIILRRLSSCRPETEALVVSAAVLGLRTRPATLAAVAGLEDLTAALDEAVEQRLLDIENGPAGQVISFAHPLVRSAVYHDLGPTRVAEVRRRAAGAAVDRWEQLRHLAAASSGVDDALAEALFEEGRRSALLGPAGAAVAAEAFRAAADKTADGPERDELVLRSIESRIDAGDTSGIVRGALGDDSVAPSARRRLLEGMLALREARQDEALSILESAWELWDEDRSDPDLGTSIAAHVAAANLALGRWTQLPTWGTRSRAAGGMSSSASGTLCEIVARASMGDVEGARALLGWDVPGVAPERCAPAHLMGEGTVALLGDDDEAARVGLRDALLAARRERNLAVAIPAAAFLGESETRAGLYDDAIRDAGFAASLAEDTGSLWTLTNTLVSLAMPLALRGDHEQARIHLESARPWAFADPTRLGVAHTEAVLSWAEGDAAGVVTASEALDHLAMRLPHSPALRGWRPIVADAAIRLGDFDRAERHLDLHDEACAASGLRRSAAGARRVRAELLAARGRTEEATALFAASLAAVEAEPDLMRPLDRGLLHASFGAHLRRLGRRTDAAEQLRAAIARFTALQALPFRTRAERELAACGLTPAKRSAQGSGPVELTPQERSIAVLASRGTRNKEIASELIISPKTVEYHLGNVFRKLGISNRGQLGTALDDVG